MRKLILLYSQRDRALLGLVPFEAAGCRHVHLVVSQRIASFVVALCAIGLLLVRPSKSLGHPFGLYRIAELDAGEQVPALRALRLVSARCFGRLLKISGLVCHQPLLEVLDLDLALAVGVGGRAQQVVAFWIVEGLRRLLLVLVMY